MGSSASPPSPPSSGFLDLFRRHAGPDGTLPFARFMALALYDPAVGYYRSDQMRVGYGAATDFFTASTSGPVFGELLVAAIIQLLAGKAPHHFSFVEIGAEPGGGVLKGVVHPFAAVRTIGVGEPIELTGHSIVFSNELFDAQPFRRFVFRKNTWLELGVALREGAFATVELPTAAPPELPAGAPEGYVIDAPLAAADLTREIAAQPWTGLFVACDYGKSWRELIEACPAGTARSYYRHTQSNDLLARPGQQDLTCHVCWDWLATALSEQGFTAPVVESQEAFFIHHAASYIAVTTEAEAARFSQKKLTLLQLLHPAHLGQKFQVLHARRD
ncbi:MAG: SAM-dependent methyltransferase [Opitutaceae bacterium]